MKHRHSNRILGRRAHQRHQLLKALSSSLLRHGHVVTTEARAKEVRRFLEPLITRARHATTLAAHRALLAALWHKADVAQLRRVAQRLNRPGGYLRLTKLVSTRGDGGSQVRLELLEEK